MATLQNAVVVITGGAMGVGRVLALEAAARGASVLIGDISDASGTVKAIREVGGAAEWLICDVADYDSVAALCARATEVYGGVNVLVNSGGHVVGRLHEVKPDDVKQLFAINVFGVFNCIHAFAPALKTAAEAGKPAFILNVGSEHSLGVPPHVPPVSAYTVAKYTSLGFTDTARRDLAGSGISVSMLAPGWVLTEKVRGAVQASKDWAAMIEPYAQPPDEVAKRAFDGLLAGAYIIPTNPKSRAFAMDHARNVMAEIQTLPLVEEDAAHSHDGGGDPNKCPVMHSC
jgi:NAD(P)-dependent dehydrogenase (short-subunit alcohol dehydrogenase family)